MQIRETIFLRFWVPFKILFLVALYMENKCRKVDLNMCGYVQSLTDPIEEHKETMSLDLDFKHLQRVCLGKSYFNYYKLMSKPLRMAVKTHLSSMDPKQKVPQILQVDDQTTNNGCQDSAVLNNQKPIKE